MKWILPALALGFIAVGCTPNKKTDASMSASAVQPAVMNVPAAPPASFTPAPPVAPQPVVYDTPGASQQSATADSVAMDTAAQTAAPEARPASYAPAPVHHYVALRGTHYKVKKGDSLWAIATTHYGNGNKWKTIAAANPRLNPDHLLVGQTIVLP